MTKGKCEIKRDIHLCLAFAANTNDDDDDGGGDDDDDQEEYEGRIGIKMRMIKRIMITRRRRRKRRRRTTTMIMVKESSFTSWAYNIFKFVIPCASYDMNLNVWTTSDGKGWVTGWMFTTVHRI